MKHVISLKNVKFATINNKFGVDKKGELYLTQEYRDFKNLIFLSAKRGYVRPPYKIKIISIMYQDYDNVLKPITDALKLAKIIKDDRFVLQAEITKIPALRGQLGTLDVWIGTIE